MAKPKPCPIHRVKPDVGEYVDCFVVRCTASVVCLEYGDLSEDEAIHGWNDLVSAVTKWKKGKKDG